MSEKKEYSSNQKDWFYDWGTVKFLFKLMESGNVGLTGEYQKKEDEYGYTMYSLETILYQTYDGTKHKETKKYSSQYFLQENPEEVENFLEFLRKYFWTQGWIHGDLDPSNTVIHYPEENKHQFKIFDFEFVEYIHEDTSIGYVPNTVRTFKFIWTDIRRFMREYLNLTLRLTPNNTLIFVYDDVHEMKLETQDQILLVILNYIVNVEDHNSTLRLDQILPLLIRVLTNFAVRIHEEKLPPTTDYLKSLPTLDDMKLPKP